MANEKTVTLSMTASKGGANVNSVSSTGAASSTYDMTGVDMDQGTQATSTTTTALNLGAVVAPYDVLLVNMSTTANENISIATVNTNPMVAPFATLQPGREAFIPVPAGATLYVASSLGTPNLFKVLCED